MPPAWQTAFDAARDRRMTGTGDLLLGINAHVNRDLPFVLASMGLVRPDGQSGKADFDKADLFLNDASDALMAELSKRFDPTIDDVNDPLGVSYGSVMQMLTTWREVAWRNAEALVNAPTPAARALVAQGIENARELRREHDPAVAGLHPAADHHDCARCVLLGAQGRCGPDRLPVRHAHAVRRLIPPHTSAPPGSSPGGALRASLHLPAWLPPHGANVTSLVTEALLPQPSVAVSVTV